MGVIRVVIMGATMVASTEAAAGAVGNGRACMAHE